MWHCCELRIWINNRSNAVNFMRSRIFTRFLHILRFTPCVYSDFKLTHHKTVSHFRKKKWHRFNGQEIKMIILTLVLDWIFKKMKFKYLCISILISNWLLFCDLFLTHGILGTLYVCTFRFMHNSNMLMCNWVAFFYLGHFNFAFIIYLYNNFFFFLYF